METPLTFVAGVAVIFTGRNEVVAKVIFLHLSVILFTGGGGRVSASVHAGMAHPRADTPPGQTPPGADMTPRSDMPPLEQTCPRVRHAPQE